MLDLLYGPSSVGLSLDFNVVVVFEIRGGKKHIERNLNEYTHRDIEFSIIEFSPNLGFIVLYCKL